MSQVIPVFNYKKEENKNTLNKSPLRGREIGSNILQIKQTELDIISSYSNVQNFSPFGGYNDSFSSIKFDSSNNNQHQLDNIQIFDMNNEFGLSFASSIPQQNLEDQQNLKGDECFLKNNKQRQEPEINYFNVEKTQTQIQLELFKEKMESSISDRIKNSFVEIKSEINEAMKDFVKVQCEDIFQIQTEVNSFKQQQIQFQEALIKNIQNQIQKNSSTTLQIIEQNDEKICNLENLCCEINTQIIKINNQIHNETNNQIKQLIQTQGMNELSQKELSKHFEQKLNNLNAENQQNLSIINQQLQKIVQEQNQEKQNFKNLSQSIQSMSMQEGNSIQLFQEQITLFQKNLKTIGAQFDHEKKELLNKFQQNQIVLDDILQQKQYDKQQDNGNISNLQLQIQLLKIETDKNTEGIAHQQNNLIQQTQMQKQLQNTYDTQMKTLNQISEKLCNIEENQINQNLNLKNKPQNQKFISFDINSQQNFNIGALNRDSNQSNSSNNAQDQMNIQAIIYQQETNNSVNNQSQGLKLFRGQTFGCQDGIDKQDIISIISPRSDEKNFLNKQFSQTDLKNNKDQQGKMIENDQIIENSIQNNIEQNNNNNINSNNIPNNTQISQQAYFERLSTSHNMATSQNKQPLTQRNKRRIFENEDNSNNNMHTSKQLTNYSNTQSPQNINKYNNNSNLNITKSPGNENKNNQQEILSQQQNLNFKNNYQTEYQTHQESKHIEDNTKNKSQEFEIVENNLTNNIINPDENSLILNQNSINYSSISKDQQQNFNDIIFDSVCSKFSVEVRENQRELMDILNTESDRGSSFVQQNQNNSLLDEKSCQENYKIFSEDQPILKEESHRFSGLPEIQKISLSEIDVQKNLNNMFNKVLSKEQKLDIVQEQEDSQEFEFKFNENDGIPNYYLKSPEKQNIRIEDNLSPNTNFSLSNTKSDNSYTNKSSPEQKIIILKKNDNVELQVYNSLNSPLIPQNNKQSEIQKLSDTQKPLIQIANVIHNQILKNTQNEKSIIINDCSPNFKQNQKLDLNYQSISNQQNQQQQQKQQLNQQNSQNQIQNQKPDFHINYMLLRNEITDELQEHNIGKQNHQNNQESQPQIQKEKKNSDLQIDHEYRKENKPNSINIYNEFDGENNNSEFIQTNESSSINQNSQNLDFKIQYPKQINSNIFQSQESEDQSHYSYVSIKQDQQDKLNQKQNHQLHSQINQNINKSQAKQIQQLKDIFEESITICQSTNFEDQEENKFYECNSNANQQQIQQEKENYTKLNYQQKSQQIQIQNNQQNDNQEQHIKEKNIENYENSNSKEEQESNYQNNQKQQENNDSDILYQLDDNGYLIDEKGNYILDDTGNCIKLSEEHIQYLKESNILEEYTDEEDFRNKMNNK